MQIADGGDSAPRGGQQTAEPPVPMETAEDDGSVGPWQEQSDGVDGARSENGALARHEYNLLASEATEGGPANAGAAGSEDGHGALENREGTETEEKGYETPQRALPAQETNGGDTEARGPSKWSRALNACGRQGGRTPQPSLGATCTRSGGGGR